MGCETALQTCASPPFLDRGLRSSPVGDPLPSLSLLASTSMWDNAGRIMGTFCCNHGLRAVLITLAVVVCISESPCSPHILPKAGGTPLT